MLQLRDEHAVHHGGAVVRANVDYNVVTVLKRKFMIYSHCQEFGRTRKCRLQHGHRPEAAIYEL